MIADIVSLCLSDDLLCVQEQQHLHLRAAGRALETSLLHVPLVGGATVGPDPQVLYLYPIARTYTISTHQQRLGEPAVCLTSQRPCCLDACAGCDVRVSQ